jgi:hypothetical protein
LIVPLSQPFFADVGDDDVEGFQLRKAQITELAHLQFAEPDRAERNPGQLQNLVADAGKQPTELAVVAFGQNDFQPGTLADLFDRLHRPHAEPRLGESNPFLE